MQLETVKVKADTPKGYRIINRSDYDPNAHKLAEGEADPGVPLNEAEQKLADEATARRKIEANRGQASGAGVVSDRNPDGTYSEPTPTDIRYPNKDNTEFANNHGAFVGRSAAEIREAEGMEDKPGGLDPSQKEAEDAAEAERKLAAKRQRDGEVEVRRGRKPAEPTENLDEMTVAQLREYATENEIDLGGARTKDEIRAAIDAAEAT